MENNNTIQKRQLEGVVVSDKMQKTAVVAVTRIKMHKKYEKRILVTKRFKAENPDNQYKTGDKVVIEATRPLSKEKKWKIVNKV
ncbi:MAG: 30S ribosomal protein S17 [Candidatus Colwellbacteria bacterium]|nr:30S ribosomal protein S17 [Candidatus Colwellbacteria bacterium]